MVARVDIREGMCRLTIEDHLPVGVGIGQFKREG